jgi:RNA-binding protein NOB1
MPKGGKHSNYPILSEDQPRAHNFPSKRSQIKTDALDPDYCAQSSPFAIKDVYSKAATLGIRSNEARILSSRLNKRKY